MWRCSACGYMHDGDEPPDKCPKCGAAQEKFVAVEGKAMELVERSRFTNNLHIHLFALLEQVIDVAEDGIDDNLDTGCVKIFKKALGEAERKGAVSELRTLLRQAVGRIVCQFQEGTPRASGRVPVAFVKGFVGLIPELCNCGAYPTR